MSPTLKKVLTSLLIYIAIGLGVYLAYCDDCFSDTWESVHNIGFSMVLAFALAEGNGRLSGWLDERVSWIETPFRRVLVGIICLIVYSIVATTILGFIYVVFVIGAAPKYFLPSLPNLLYNALAITAVIALVSYTNGFLQNWREAAIQAEKLKRERLAAQYSSLKNQLKPHFLFNSLNALSSLVYKNADQSAQFIKQLSEVYRYILEHSDKEVVPLEAEMKCVEAYLFLMKIRFGENLHLKIDIPNPKSTMVAPMSVQMLVENALKHNIISKDRPLYLSVRQVGKQLEVLNNLQKKVQHTPSTGVGLNNIRERYKFLTEREVEVMESESHFSVKIPLVLLQYESTHH